MTTRINQLLETNISSVPQSMHIHLVTITRPCYD
uniref:Uncharacterized protein n=1 Tax=Arundo donax TaxID=35708 RepID=A0A0A9C2W6_ARUDO